MYFVFRETISSNEYYWNIGKILGDSIDSNTISLTISHPCPHIRNCRLSIDSLRQVETRSSKRKARKSTISILFAERVCVSDRGLASISERNIIEAGALFLRSRNIFVSLTNAVLITLDRVIFCSLFFSPLFPSLSLSLCFGRIA